MINSTSSAVIKKWSVLFSEYGSPYLFRSDSGPSYIIPFLIRNKNRTKDKLTLSTVQWISNIDAESIHEPDQKAILQAKLIFTWRITPISFHIQSGRNSVQ